MRFTATLRLHGKTATGIEVPEEVVLGLGPSKRPAVVVTINEFSYRSTIAPYGGSYLLPVAADIRAGARVEAGDVLDVLVELDAEPRAVEVPADLAKALTSHKGAKAFFESLSFSNQRGYVDWITSAKKEETRVARVAKALESLAAGRKQH
jgi:hypothetical protein